MQRKIAPGWLVTRGSRSCHLKQAQAVALRPLGSKPILMIKANAVISLVTGIDLMGAPRFVFARSFDLTVYLYAAVKDLVPVEIIRRSCEAMERRLTRPLTRA